ncbi:MAG: 2-dehydro-3-deoxygalactonokinase [Clostridia bacterium]|nr:2-dehydro-3-deoxygalactonokinase [Clostridia bacterium]
MKNYITIDGGTTNTRIHLVQDRRVFDSIKFSIGANKENERWEEIKNGIAEILRNNNLTEKDIIAVLASGMITRSYPHITAPAGIKELHNGMVKADMDEITAIPFYFIRGVRTDCDMIRGEETEIVGINNGQRKVYILPGTHSKIMSTDECGRITDIKTMLTGEMAAVLSKFTILNESVDIKTNIINKEFLFYGFDYCKQNGINNALFKVRILDKLENKTPAEIYSFFMGVILCEEITAIVKMNPESLTLAGKLEFVEPMSILIERETNSEINIIDDTVPFSAVGAVKIFEVEK